MSSVPPDEIVRDARWLAQALDPPSGMLRLVRMDPEAYRSASFLDDRILQGPHEAQIVSWNSVAEALSPFARVDAGWIFHIGHVGSTLVARLLGEIEGVLSVREPRSLRDLAALPEDQRATFVPGLQRLMSRTFNQSETALVKATSFVSEIAAELVPAGGRALFLHASPRNYIASILAGQNSLKELTALMAPRAQRLASRAVYPPPRNESEAAAAAWACEMTSLEAAADVMGENALWADFDRHLENLPAGLVEFAGHFGFDVSAQRIEEIATGPLTRRYAKAPEFDYSPAVRRDLIVSTAERNRADVDAAIAILHSTAAKAPLLARALERTKED
ncbi:MAG: hypothetical protein ACJ8E0_09475 [Sphingomicrobium sp.]